MSAAARQSEAAQQSARHIVCPHYQAINRIPPDKPAREAKCDRCHKPLLARLDKWRKAQPEEPSRASALRQMAEHGLLIIGY